MKASSTPSHPNLPALHDQIFEAAVEFHRADQLDKAEALYRAVLALNAAHAEASYNVGLIYHGQNRLQEALAAYRDAVFARIDYVDAYANMATVLKDLGKPQEASILYRQAIAYAPERAMTWSNLGVVLNDMGQHAEAAMIFRQAAALQPDYEWTYINMAPVLLELGMRAASVEACRRTLAISPREAIAHYNLGASVKTLNQIDTAIAAFEQAIAANPNFAEAHFALGQTLLMAGDFERGWPEYEWRWQCSDYGWLRNIHGEFTQPRWRGEDLAGKTILIYAEQGLGDAIQYARYIPWVVAKGGRVILAVHPPLISLFSAIEGVEVVSLADTPLPSFDFHSPLLSLPLVFGTRPDTIPAKTPYLFADPVKAEAWSKRLRGDGLKVGIVWAGNPTQKGDRWRSPHLAAFQPLFAVPGVDFVALQVGKGREDIQTHPLPANVQDLGEEIKDFSDTAAIMMSLDLVISSCTAPLHMACALGVPTWAMIPHAPHFLWQLERSDSPWYPTLRLYRQDEPGVDWTGAAGRVARDLTDLVKSRMQAGKL